MIANEEHEIEDSMIAKQLDSIAEDDVEASAYNGGGKTGLKNQPSFKYQQNLKQQQSHKYQQSRKHQQSPKNQESLKNQQSFKDQNSFRNQSSIQKLMSFQQQQSIQSKSAALSRLRSIKHNSTETATYTKNSKSTTRGTMVLKRRKRGLPTFVFGII